MWVIFALLDPDPQFECGSMRIRIRNPAIMQLLPIFVRVLV